MSSLFLRLLPHNDKAGALRQAVSDLAQGQRANSVVYIANPQSFRKVPGSPFAYWVHEALLSKFVELLPLESQGRQVCHGAASKNDFQFLRLHCEVPVENVGPRRRWMPFAKGGKFARYYEDVELLINWERDAAEIREYVSSRYPYLKGNTDWVLHPENSYGSPGITFPRRPYKWGSFRALPAGCVFADNGPVIFAPRDELFRLLAVLNSALFNVLVQIRMGRGTSASGQTLTYEVGLVGSTPLAGDLDGELEILAEAGYEIGRALDTVQLTSHVFVLPALLIVSGETVTERLASWQTRMLRDERALRDNQREVNEITYRLYGLSETERQNVEESLNTGNGAASKCDEYEQEARNESAEVHEEEAESAVTFVEPAFHVQDLLSYAIGCALGRWDGRIAAEQSLAPKLQGPFDLLPVCPPGMLIGPDGLPVRPGGIVSEEWLRARPNAITLPPEGSISQPTIPDSEYPLQIVWDGILVDDPDHQDDIVRRVREVLELLWKDRAAAIEQEACEILGVKSLRNYFRNPKRFWDEHVKRYSKSRRKAPIYWLLQSPKRHYALWLYYHHLDQDMLYKALRNYVDPKHRREESRLRELRERLPATPEGRERKVLEKQIDDQETVMNDVMDFKERLEKVAKLGLDPDLNDGVVLNIAPLHELVPWREPKKYWDDLLAGKYEWSTIGKQLREKGLVRG